MILWDDTVKRNFGILIWILLLGFGVVLFEILEFNQVPFKYIVYAEIIWYALDAFIASWMWHVFKLRKSDILLPKLIEVNDPRINSEVNNNTDEVPADPQPDIPDSALSG